MTTRVPPVLAIVLACVALAACGSAPGAPDGPSPAYRAKPQDVYPTGTALGADPPPGAPDCLRAPELSFASERAFVDCRRDLEVYELALDLWSRRIAGAVGAELRRRDARARASLACKLGGGSACEPVGYGVMLLSQPRPPACVGDALPIALDGDGPDVANCRYGVELYRGNLTEWARTVAYEARLEAEAAFNNAVHKFNCKLIGRHYYGMPCY